MTLIFPTGLDLPGFLTGSNFLLPWEIIVQTERDKWPTVGETSAKKGKQKKSSRGKGKQETSLISKYFMSKFQRDRFVNNRRCTFCS